MRQALITLEQSNKGKKGRYEIGRTGLGGEILLVERLLIAFQTCNAGMYVRLDGYNRNDAHQRFIDVRTGGKKVASS